MWRRPHETRRNPSRSAVLRRVGIALSLLFFATLSVASAQDTDQPDPSLVEAWTEGTFSLRFNLRYEGVSDESPPVRDNDAQALTLRTVGGYKTKSWKGLQFHLEFEDVTAIGGDGRYNNAGFGALNNGVRNRPVIADPEITEISQVRLIYAGLPETTLDLGRREIVLGNSRFVGNVGWRQNHQSFEALTVVNESLDNVRFSYSLVDKVNRITGEAKPMTSHFFNVGGALKKINLTGYVYALDYDRFADRGLSTTTFGLRADGRRAFGDGDLSFLYDFEIAEQSDAGDNTSNVDAGYLRLDLGVGWGKLSLRLAREVLDGGEGKGAFQTPLATLHKWNGWADKFLTTPAGGLEDTNINLSGNYDPYTFTVRYHRFEADSTNAHYGNELDMQATYETSWGQTFGFKAAFYDADEFAFDSDKYMLWSGWGF